MKTCFENLEVWRLSFKFALKIYKITAGFPSDEKYALSSQLKRSASSISANIADGKGRESDKEFKRFLYIARGSLEESKSHLLLAQQLNYIDDENFNKVEKLSEEVGLKLNGLIKSLL